jgi:hypothetical protein
MSWSGNLFRNSLISLNLLTSIGLTSFVGPMSGPWLVLLITHNCRKDLAADRKSCLVSPWLSWGVKIIPEPMTMVRQIWYTLGQVPGHKPTLRVWAWQGVEKGSHTQINVHCKGTLGNVGASSRHLEEDLCVHLTAAHIPFSGETSSLHMLREFILPLGAVSNQWLTDMKVSSPLGRSKSSLWLMPPSLSWSQA